MGWNNVSAGDKIAKPVGMRMVTASTGKEAVEIVFEFEGDDGGRERLEWQGWTSPPAVDFTMKTLKDVLGYDRTKATIGVGGVFVDPNVINFEREVKLVVEIEKYKTEAGEEKEKPRIKWINTLGGSKFKGLDPREASSSRGLAALNQACIIEEQKSGGTGNFSSPTQQQPARKTPF